MARPGAGRAIASNIHLIYINSIRHPVARRGYHSGNERISAMIIRTVSAAALVFALATPALADGDAAKGEQVFKLCMACHSAKDKNKKVGPHLMGIVGRPIASVEGFAYSDGMKAYAEKEKAWDEAKLLAYVENPKGVVPGTKMAFGGVKDAEKRENLIAYLKTLAP
jgi:cytochrome c